MHGNALKIVVLTMVIYIVLVKAVAAGNAICISQILLILINSLSESIDGMISWEYKPSESHNVILFVFLQ